MNETTIIEQEQWRDIEGYEGSYKVSNMGRVMSNYGGRGSGWRIIHGGINGSGCLLVKLSAGGKYVSRSLPQLVAQAFVPNPDGLRYVRHIDDDPLNNKADNLEWCQPVFNDGRTSRLYAPKPDRSREVADLDGEQWRAVVGYEGEYEVSNLGRIKSLKKHKAIDPLLRPCTDDKGRKAVILRKDGERPRRMSVHRLVAFAFVSGYRDGLEVNHKDENPQNNRADNLEWVTKSQNINHGTRNRRCAEKRGRRVVQLDDAGRIVAEHLSIRAAAVATGDIRSERNIRLCLNGKREHARGYRWQYAQSSKS